MKRSWLLQLCKKCVRVFCLAGAALFCTLIIIQNDAWLVSRCEHGLAKAMEKLYGCHFRGQVAALNLVTGTIILKNIVVEDCNAAPHTPPGWSWSAKKITLSWSWKDLIFLKKCGITIMIDSLLCKSSFSLVDSVSSDAHVFNLAIMPHIQLLCAPATMNVPFDLETCAIRDGHLYLHEVDESTRAKGFELQANLSCEIGNHSDVLRALVLLNNGLIWRGSKVFAEHIEVKNSWKNEQCGVDARFCVPALPEDFRSIKVCGNGNVLQGVGSCNVTNESGSCILTAQSSNGKDVFGDISSDMYEKNNRGTWQYDHQTGKLSFSWVDVAVPGHLQTGIDAITGSFFKNDLAVKFLGKEQSGELVCSFSDQMFLKKGTYIYGPTTLLSCSGDEQGFAGAITNEVMHSIAKLAGIDFQGEGSFEYKGCLQWPLCTLALEMKQGHIRIPQTYSVIQNIRAESIVDVSQRQIILQNAHIGLYKGSISCSQATLELNEQGSIVYAHIPLIAHKCFFGWKKDLFAQISGSVMVSLEHDKASKIAGSFTVDQAHIRGNVLSSEFQQDFFGTVLQSFSSRTVASPAPSQADTDCLCDVSYATRSPLEIKTPFLEGAVVWEGHFGGSLRDPFITGKVSFIRGTLAFPYKPLFITKGVVTVRPESLDDPFIDLVARGHIKKYDIELVVSGSVRNPHIVFSSSPFLEQANIITLLLGGSEDGSLYFLMPKVITNTLESLLFGPAHATSRVQKYLKNLVRPFKGMSITPRLSDQEGRGGVRGALAFEVNDRLRATIAKNVSLPEDTTFEVEYDISDDTSFRAMRDERGDLGLEGEMRWKF